MLKSKILTIVTISLMVAFSGIIHAHPDKIARVTDKITIQASVDTVFSIINQSDSEQAKRILTQKKDANIDVIFNEIKYKKKPEEIKNIKHIKYIIDSKDSDNTFSLFPGKYILKIKLKQKGENTNIKWIIEYEVGNRGALTESEKGAKKNAVKNVLDKGLKNLKSWVESS